MRLLGLFGGTAALALGLLTATPASAQTLIHHYQFNAGVTDSVGGAHGTLFGNANVSGGALHLDGNGDYVEFGSHLVPTSGSYTVAFHAKENIIQTGIHEMISQGHSGGPGFYIGPAGRSFRLSDGIFGAAPMPSDLGFHHYALSVNAGEAKSRFYIDGNLVFTANFAIATTGAGTHTRLGRQFAPYDEYFNGQLRDVRIYSGALNEAQVDEIAAPPNASAVPEPSAALLFLPALGVVAVLRRRRVS